MGLIFKNPQTSESEGTSQVFTLSPLTYSCAILFNNIAANCD